jgi:hypothetical protein
MRKILLTLFLCLGATFSLQMGTYAAGIQKNDSSSQTFTAEDVSWFLGHTFVPGENKDIWKELKEQNDQYRKELEELRQKIKDGEVTPSCSEERLEELLQAIEDTLDLIDFHIENKSNGKTIFQLIAQLGMLLCQLESECQVDIPSFDHDCDQQQK